MLQNRIAEGEAYLRRAEALPGTPLEVKYVSAFVDQGRVWRDGVVLGELFTDLHRGVGGGVRLGWGEDFVVALDVGTSKETTAPLYVGLGYLY